jgi:hypothetical protein
MRELDSGAVSVGETARGLISLAICVHLGIVGLGLITSFESSPLQRRILELAAPYGATLPPIPYALPLSLTHGTPIDEDHQLVVRILATGAGPSTSAAAGAGDSSAALLKQESEQILRGQGWCEPAFLRRLARRLDEYNAVDDTETAAVLAAAIGGRAMRQYRAGRIEVESQRLQLADLPSESGRGRAGETAYSAQVMLDNRGELIVVKGTPLNEASPAVDAP